MNGVNPQQREKIIANIVELPFYPRQAQGSAERRTVGTRLLTGAINTAKGINVANWAWYHRRASPALKDHLNVPEPVVPVNNDVPADQA